MLLDKQFIFLAGHHRSGTSLLHEIIRDHPLVSGFSETGVPEDEGQHLQTVYEPAKTFGKAGTYLFNPKSYMDESHPLATDESAQALLAQWEPYYDQSCSCYIEKSPPNLVRTRFLQKLFPNSCFVVIFRHPLAVGYATQRTSRTSIKSLVEHTLIGYERFLEDRPYLNRVHILRYEEFVLNPKAEVDKIYAFLGLEPVPIQHTIQPHINEKYFAMWRANRKNIFKRFLFPVSDELENRANRFGYSLIHCRDLLPFSF